MFPENEKNDVTACESVHILLHPITSVIEKMDLLPRQHIKDVVVFANRERSLSMFVQNVLVQNQSIIGFAKAQPVENALAST